MNVQQDVLLIILQIQIGLTMMRKQQSVSIPAKKEELIWTLQNSKKKSSPARKDALAVFYCHRSQDDHESQGMTPQTSNKNYTNNYNMNQTPSFNIPSNMMSAARLMSMVGSANKNDQFFQRDSITTFRQQRSSEHIKTDPVTITTTSKRQNNKGPAKRAQNYTKRINIQAQQYAQSQLLQKERKKSLAIKPVNVGLPHRGKLKLEKTEVPSAGLVEQPRSQYVIAMLAQVGQTSDTAALQNSQNSLNKQESLGSNYLSMMMNTLPTKMSFEQLSHRVQSLDMTNELNNNYNNIQPRSVIATTTNAQTIERNKGKSILSEPSQRSIVQKSASHLSAALADHEAKLTRQGVSDKKELFQPSDSSIMPANTIISKQKQLSQILKQDKNVKVSKVESAEQIDTKQHEFDNETKLSLFKQMNEMNQPQLQEYILMQSLPQILETGQPLLDQNGSKKLLSNKDQLMALQTGMQPIALTSQFESDLPQVANHHGEMRRASRDYVIKSARFQDHLELSAEELPQEGQISNHHSHTSSYNLVERYGQATKKVAQVQQYMQPLTHKTAKTTNAHASILTEGQISFIFNGLSNHDEGGANAQPPQLPSRQTSQFHFRNLLEPERFETLVSAGGGYETVEFKAMEPDLLSVKSEQESAHGGLHMLLQEKNTKQKEQTSKHTQSQLILTDPKRYELESNQIKLHSGINTVQQLTESLSQRFLQKNVSRPVRMLHQMPQSVQHEFDGKVLPRKTQNEVLIGKNEIIQNPVSIVTMIKNRKENGFITEVNEQFLNTEASDDFGEKEELSSRNRLRGTRPSQTTAMFSPKSQMTLGQFQQLRNQNHHKQQGKQISKNCGESLLSFTSQRVKDLGERRQQLSMVESILGPTNEESSSPEIKCKDSIISTIRESFATQLHLTATDSIMKVSATKRSANNKLEIHKALNHLQPQQNQEGMQLHSDLVISPSPPMNKDEELTIPTIQLTGDQKQIKSSLSIMNPDEMKEGKSMARSSIIKRHFFSNDRINTRKGRNSIHEKMTKPERYGSARTKAGPNQGRSGMKASQYDESSIRKADTILGKTSSLFINLDQAKFEGNGGKVKYEKSMTQRQGMLGQSPFVDLCMIKQPVIVQSDIAAGLHRQLQDDFENSMMQITSARAAIISTKAKKENLKIKRFSTHKELRALPKLTAEDNILFNKQVHDQVKLLPKSGRLTRLHPSPFANQNFKKVDTFETRVKINTKVSMQLGFEKSVKIYTFNDPSPKYDLWEDEKEKKQMKEKAKLDALGNLGTGVDIETTEQKLIDESDGNSIVESENYGTEEENTEDDETQKEEKKLKRVTAREIYKKQKTMRSLATFHGFIRESLEDAILRMPKVKPLNLTNMSKEIGFFVRQQKKGCQSYGIVSTPTAIKQGAKLQIQREKRVIKRIKLVEKRFEQDKEQRDNNLINKWSQVQDAYCIDFKGLKQAELHTEHKKKYQRLIKNLVDQCRIISDKKFPYDYEILLERSLFPSESYQYGEVKQFFKEVKFGNLLNVSKMIQQDPLLVFQYDEMQQNALIWAVKRKNLLMARFLVKNFSQVNFKDLAGRTALNFAVAEQNLEMVKILVCFKADPSSENNNGKKIIDLYRNLDLEVDRILRLGDSQLRLQQCLTVIWSCQMRLFSMTRRPTLRKESAQEKFAQSGESAKKQLASDIAPRNGWTKKERRDREWKNNVLSELDPHGELEQDEEPFFK